MNTLMTYLAQRAAPRGLTGVVALLVLFLLACAQPMPQTGAAGADGADGTSCTLVTEEESRKIVCDDGTEVALTDGVDGVDGEDGVDGTSCSVTDHFDGSKTIACEDGTQVVVRDGAICDVQHVEDNGDGTETLTCLGGFEIVINSRVPVEACVQDILNAAAPWQTATPEVLGVCPDLSTVVFTTFEGGTGRLANPSEVSYVIAKLEPGAPGVPHVWQSYLNRTRPGDIIQATRENNGDLRGIKPGVYAYTFSADLTAVTTPLAVPFEPDLTHRVAIEFRGGMADLGKGDLFYDWRPDGQSFDHTKLIATTESCVGCHTDGFAKHGGRTNSVEACVVCHNPGSINVETERSLDLGVIAHKIHMGKNLPSVQAGEPYGLRGFGGLYDYSELSYPQDIKNCTKCHTPDHPATPDGDSWETKANILACTACHDDIAFTQAEADEESWKTLHTGGEFSTGCVGCHSDVGPYMSAEVAHRTVVSTPNNPNVPDGLSIMKYDLVDVWTDVWPDAVTVSATFRILRDGTPIDIASPPAGFNFSGTSLRFAHSLPQGWITEPDDFTEFTAHNFTYLQANAVSNGDGSYSMEVGEVPDGAVNVAIALEGRIQQGSIRITPAAVVKGIDLDHSPRRQVVGIDNCNQCHERVAAHGDNRVDNIDNCVMCHNPMMTDINRRPADPNDAPDGLVEHSIDFSYMIHAIHMGKERHSDHTVFYGFTGAHDFKDVAYPGNLADCTTCHLPGTFGLPLGSDVLATTVDTIENKRVSPAGAACTACHDKPEAQMHAMVWTPSGDLYGTESDSCAVCHGPGRSSDVSVVHSK